MPISLSKLRQYLSELVLHLPLTHLLNSIAKDNYAIRVLNHQIKIQAKKSVEAYDRIINSLKEKNTEYHTYRKKQERNFKIVLQYVHYSTKLDSLKTEIESHRHKVLNITNMRQRTMKKPLAVLRGPKIR